jgi:A/G-specific adenine glycosylase
MLLETRPARGLLGGMPGWPGTDWDARGGGAGAGVAPLAANWREAGEVRHIFTHFDLRLTVQAALVPPTPAPTAAPLCRAPISPPAPCPP